MVPVKFTDIDMDGIVTVQLHGPGLNQLEHLMTIINETYEVHVSPTNLYASDMSAKGRQNWGDNSNIHIHIHCTCTFVGWRNQVGGYANVHILVLITRGWRGTSFF